MKESLFFHKAGFTREIVSEKINSYSRAVSKPDSITMKQPKRFPLVASVFALSLTATHLFAATDPAKAKVYDNVISPVLAAKCYDCHGATKDKGKLRLHTKEALLKGGKGSGAKIIVKGKLDDSELYYRISLPNDDDDVMPPFDEDEPHNPLTPEELKVFAAWILAGASFDAKVSDLKGDARKAAEHILKNPPKKKESSVASLQPKLPVVPGADAKLIGELQKMGLLAMPIAQNTNALYLNASYLGDKFGDAQAKKLVLVSAQTLWLNLARTKITDAGLAEVAKCEKLTRLHLENTDITDAGLAHVAKLANLEYLNLYGTKVSDAGIAHLKKLKNVKKVFLWQTRVTKAGAADLRSAFVDANAFAKLESDRDRLKGEVDKFRDGKEKEITQLDEAMKKANSTAASSDPAYEKCPLTGKPLDATKKSVYQGKTIVFCCNNCKGKFDKDPSAHKAKLKDFKPSDAFVKAKDKLDTAKDAVDAGVEEKQGALREVLTQLRASGPIINLGWEAPAKGEKKK
jgi:YHS domain-containing protein